MSLQTFNFQELDEETRSYLITVREAKGKGMPGLFAVTASSFPGCALLTGIFLIPLTLAFTLTDWVDIVYKDPVRVAFLQTAGLVVGIWLVFAFFRTHGWKGNSRRAGYWAYADGLHLYLAYREQVGVVAMADVGKAKFTHNYNNGKYQNSTVTVRLTDHSEARFTLTEELRAEQFVTFINYLVWAREEGTGQVTELEPAQLGAVARYVARNDVEPKNHEGKLDPDLAATDLDEIPEEPKKVGQATPAILPYIAILVLAAVVFPFMAFVINPPIRDNAIYDAVMHQPTEPRMLRAYLIDPRNTLHREKVLAEMSRHYSQVIQQVKTHAEQPEIRDGMVRILEAMKAEPDQPVVSVRVSERGPNALAEGREKRVNKVRDAFVGGDGLLGPNGKGVLDVFADVAPPIQPPAGVVFLEKPPPIGHQLLAFVAPPEEAKHAHFEISYEFRPAGKGDVYILNANLELRLDVTGDPIASYSQSLNTYGSDPASLDRAIDDLRKNLVVWTVGESPKANPPWVIQP
jgi:hypothetical protein